MNIGVVGEKAARSVEVAVYCAIPPQRFRHPLENSPHVAFNRDLLEFLRREHGEGAEKIAPVVNGALELNLPELIRAQFMQYGVPAAQIDIEEAFLDEDDVWGDGTPGMPRNLVGAVHYSP